MSADKKNMPCYHGKDAPRISEDTASNNKSLREYWRKLEGNFETCNITDDKKKIDYAINTYPDEEITRAWSGIAAYELGKEWATKTYAEVKRVILATYPNASEEERNTMSEMERALEKSVGI